MKQLSVSQITPKIEQKVISLYQDGRFYRQIEKTLNINQRYICQILIKYNIPRRKMKMHEKFQQGLKVCPQCHQEKSLSEFSKDNISISGINSQCKKCESQKHQNYYLKNKTIILAKSAAYRKLHPTKNHDYWHQNKERLRAIRHNKRITDPLFRAKEDEYSKQYRQRPDKQYLIKKWKTEEYQRNRKNPVARALMNSRGRIRKFLTRNYREQSSLSLIGCTISVFKKHLESQFRDGMTWNNYGKWHVDHRIPCSSFDLSDPAQQKKCFHYTNLQPLWAKENLAKGDKTPIDIDK